MLSPEDVGQLLEAAPGPALKYKAALSIAYGAGLRACELVGLTVTDIDSKRMLIRVEAGQGPRKGRKDRPCCRHGCSKCCAPGGGSADRSTQADFIASLV